MSKQSYQTFFNVTFFVAVFFISLSFFPKHAHAETTIPLSVELMCSSQDPFITVYFDAIVEDDGYITGNGVYTHPTNGKSMHLVFSGSWDRQEKYIHADIKRYYNDVNNSLTQLVRTNSFEGKFDKTTPLHSSIENDPSIDCTSYIRISVQQEDTSPATSVSDDDLYTPCHTYTALNPPSFSDFSPPYNVFSGNKENIIKARCNKNTAKIIFGDGSEDTYIWSTANIIDSKTNKWKSIFLTGDETRENGRWIVGNAEVTRELSEKQMKDGTSVSAYICHSVDNEWKCGCSGNGKCSGKWQIQEVKKRKSDRLLTTRWKQYEVRKDISGDGFKETLVPGCVATAVGQVINYYFQNGYSDSWLDRLFEGITVSAHWKTDPGSFVPYKTRKIYNLSYPTLNEYIDDVFSDKNNEEYEDNKQNVADFLYHVALGLDSDFLVSNDPKAYIKYRATRPLEWIFDLSIDTDIRIRNILNKRFRFNNVSIKKEIVNLKENRDYIVNQIDDGHPVMMGMDKDYKTGHIGIIDSYALDKKDKYYFKINMGWGYENEKDNILHRASDKWYPEDEVLSVPRINGKKYNWDIITIYENTKPIQY